MPEIKWFTNYEYVEPQSAIEKIVCEVFGRVLEIERFGANLKVHDTCYTVDIIVKKETVK